VNFSSRKVGPPVLPSPAQSSQVGSCLGLPPTTSTEQPLQQLFQVIVQRRWPDNQVFYYLDDSLLPQDEIVIRQAMQTIEDLSCVRFLPYQPGTVFDLSVTLSRDCACNPYKKRCPYVGAYASIGPLPHGIGRLTITGACLQPGHPNSIGLITHELFHTLGFPHMQERLDRDLYVQMNWANIDFVSLLNFKWNPFYKPQGIPYDCSSLMHYDDQAFSNGKGPTMTPRDPSSCELSSTPSYPTKSDVTLLRKTYPCPKQIKYGAP